MKINKLSPVLMLVSMCAFAVDVPSSVSRMHEDVRNANQDRIEQMEDEMRDQGENAYDQMESDMEDAVDDMEGAVEDANDAAHEMMDKYNHKH